MGSHSVNARRRNRPGSTIRSSFVSAAMLPASCANTAKVRARQAASRRNRRARLRHRGRRRGHPGRPAVLRPPGPPPTPARWPLRPGTAHRANVPTAFRCSVTLPPVPCVETPPWSLHARSCRASPTRCFVMARHPSPRGGGSEVYVEQMRAGSPRGPRGHDRLRRPRRRPRRRGARRGPLPPARGPVERLPARAAVPAGRGRGADVVVECRTACRSSPRSCAGAGRALVHHVHREQWQIIYPGWPGRLGWWLESRLSPRLYRRTPYVTVSEASRADMGCWVSSADRIDIVHNGIDVPHP